MDNFWKRFARNIACSILFITTLGAFYSGSRYILQRFGDGVFVAIFLALAIVFFSAIRALDHTRDTQP